MKELRRARTGSAPRPTSVRNLILVAASSLVYASMFWPNSIILSEGMRGLGYPPYGGFKGAFLPHLLFYSTFPALVAAFLWLGLSHFNLLPFRPFGPAGGSVLPGVLAGLAALAAALAVVLAFFPAGTVHWIAPAPWKIAGNVFSNFFEELIFRGFILAALRIVAGFWPAAVISAALWAALHTQYPVALQLTIFAIGILFAWLVKHAGSLMAPYMAHTVLDLCGDCLIG